MNEDTKIILKRISKKLDKIIELLAEMNKNILDWAEEDIRQHKERLEVLKGEGKALAT